MNQSLEECYERALAFLEETAPHFVGRYPAQAGGLLARGDSVGDPHLERMIEGCALLAGRVDHKIDSEFPFLIESLLQVLYPHLTLLVPSMAIVQFATPSAKPVPREGLTIAAGTTLTSRPLGRQGVACRYRTGYPTTLWPLQLQSIQWQSPPGRSPTPPPRAVAALRLRFRCADGLTFSELPLDKLRLSLQGDPPLVPQLYETLFLHCLRVDYRLLAGEQVLGTCELDAEEGLAQVGLDLDEGLLPLPPQVFPGFRHLIELLSFPSKYNFVDLVGWQQLRERVGDRRGATVEVVLHFSRSHVSLERNLTEDNIALGCTPIVNLFSKSAEPLQFNHRQAKHWVVPSRSQPAGHEVYLIEEVYLLDQGQRRSGPLRPFYASTIDGRDGMGYWLATRRASAWQDEAGVSIPGTEVDLHIVDQQLDVRRPSDAILDIHTLCSNRELPSQWQRGGDLLTLPSEQGLAVPVHAVLRGEPTKPLRPPLRHATFWRLLSQNALNHAALAAPPVLRSASKGDGQLPLQELLRLCDFSQPDSQWASVVQQFIDGITAVRSRPMQWPISSGKNLGYCRGQEILVELDESKYSSISALVFASVLERFLSLYTGVNSFVKMVLKTTQSKDIVDRWNPRTAERVLP